MFDLTDAVAKAKAEAKPLFIYLGAYDCPPCKDYEAFLEKKQAQLQGAFAKLVVVDLRTWLKGPKLVFKFGDRTYRVKEFKDLVGDQNAALLYPSYWLLSPELNQIRQLPQGSKAYLDVEEHKRLLTF